MTFCDIVLVAGGKSTRFGEAIPKQFQIVSGRPLYLWSLDVLLSWPPCGQVVVVVPAEWVEPVQKSFQSLLGTKSIQVVSGGDSRQASSARGLEKLKEISQNQ